VRLEIEFSRRQMLPDRAVNAIAVENGNSWLIERGSHFHHLLRLRPTFQEAERRSCVKLDKHSRIRVARGRTNDEHRTRLVQDTARQKRIF
jgi:hypothetical protein